MVPVEQVSLRRGKASLSQTEFDRSLWLRYRHSLDVCPTRQFCCCLPAVLTQYGLSPSLGGRSGPAGQQRFFLSPSQPLGAPVPRVISRLDASSLLDLSQRVCFATLFAVSGSASGPDALPATLPWLSPGHQLDTFHYLARLFCGGTKLGFAVFMACDTMHACKNWYTDFPC